MNANNNNSVVTLNNVGAEWFGAESIELDDLKKIVAYQFEAPMYDGWVMGVTVDTSNNVVVTASRGGSENTRPSNHILWQEEDHNSFYVVVGQIKEEPETLAEEPELVKVRYYASEENKGLSNCGVGSFKGAFETRYYRQNEISQTTEEFEVYSEGGDTVLMDGWRGDFGIFVIMGTVYKPMFS